MSANNGDYTIGSGGGFINPKHAKPRVQKMKWTAENDRKLLLIGLGKEIIPKEYPAITTMFPEKPTPKAIQERLTKLRSEQHRIIAELNLSLPITKIHSYIAGQHEADTSMSGSPGASTAYSGGLHLPTVSPTSDEQEAADSLIMMSQSRESWYTPPQPSRKRAREESLDTDISSGGAISVEGPSTNASQKVNSDVKPRIHKMPRETRPKKKPRVPPISMAGTQAQGVGSHGFTLYPRDVLLKAAEEFKERKAMQERKRAEAEDEAKAALEAMAREKAEVDELFEEGVSAGGKGDDGAEEGGDEGMGGVEVVGENWVGGGNEIEEMKME